MASVIQMVRSIGHTMFLGVMARRFQIRPHRECAHGKGPVHAQNTNHAKSISTSGMSD
jgi:hypothetical protein